MGFLDGIFKKKGIVLGAYMEGRCVEIKEVNDPTFSGEILGKGAAIIPSDGKVYAPADGEISTVFPTGHAVGMMTEDGAEILIHVGLDTVELKGEHFTSHVEAGRKVKKGDLLLTADIEKIKAAGYDTVTPIVICNTDAFKSIEGMTGKEVKVGDDILQLSK